MKISRATALAAGLLLLLCGVAAGLSFSAPETVGPLIDGATGSTAADLDGDGDLDLVMTGWRENQIEVAFNDGTGAFSAPQLVSTLILWPFDVEVGDLNGDGKADILAAANFNRRLGWFEGNGDGTFKGLKVISSDIRGSSLAIFDADKDGDLDVVVGGENKVFLYVNSGTGTFGTKVTIDSSLIGTWAIEIADVDHNNWDDIVVAADDKDYVGVFYNNGNNFFNALDVINQPFGLGAIDVAVGDLDGDGFVDVAAAFGTGNKFSYFINDGGQYMSQNDLVGPSSGARALSISDVDGDGDNDIVAASSTDGDLVVYENLGGSPVAFSRVVVSTALGSVFDVNTVDLDGDGFDEIVVSDVDANAFLLFRNTDGPGSQTVTGAVQISPGPGEYLNSVLVGMISATAGAQIYYTTDGTAPDSTISTLYTGPFEWTTLGATTFTAVAVADGLENSGLSATTLVVQGQVPTPQFSPVGGPFVQHITVSMAVSDPFASIYYTTDGTQPTLASSLFTADFTWSVLGTTSFRIVAVRAGYFDSTVISASVTLHGEGGAAVFSPNGGSFSDSVTISLTSSTPAAFIYYTLDGSTPTAASTLYVGPFSVTKPGATLVKTLVTASTFVAAYADQVFTIQPAVTAPVINPNGGEFFGSVTGISITSATPSAEIYYTIDGTTPTQLSTVYSGIFDLTTTGTVTVRALATSPGLASSTVTSATFEITSMGSDTCSAANAFDAEPELYSLSASGGILLASIRVPSVEGRTVTGVTFGSTGDPLCTFPGGNWEVFFSQTCCCEQYTFTIAVVDLGICGVIGVSTRHLGHHAESDLVGLGLRDTSYNPEVQVDFENTVVSYDSGFPQVTVVPSSSRVAVPIVVDDDGNLVAVAGSGDGNEDGGPGLSRSAVIVIASIAVALALVLVVIALFFALRGREWAGHRAEYEYGYYSEETDDQKRLKKKPARSGRGGRGGGRAVGGGKRRGGSKRHGNGRVKASRYRGPYSSTSGTASTTSGSASSSSDAETTSSVADSPPFFVGELATKYSGSSSIEAHRVASRRAQSGRLNGKKSPRGRKGRSKKRKQARRGKSRRSRKDGSYSAGSKAPHRLFGRGKNKKKAAKDAKGGGGGRKKNSGKLSKKDLALLNLSSNQSYSSGAAVVTKAKRLANQSTTSLSSFDPYEYSNLYSVNTNEARARNQVSEYSTKASRFSLGDYDNLLVEHPETPLYGDGYSADEPRYADYEHSDGYADPVLHGATGSIGDDVLDSGDIMVDMHAIRPAYVDDGSWGGRS